MVSLANHVCGWWPMVIAGKMVASSLLFSSLPLTKSENENVFAVMLSVVLCTKYVCLCRLLQLFHNKTLQKLFHRYNRPRREKTALGEFLARIAGVTVAFASNWGEE